MAAGLHENVVFPPSKAVTYLYARTLPVWYGQEAGSVLASVTLIAANTSLKWSIRAGLTLLLEKGDSLPVRLRHRGEDTHV